MRTQVLKIWLEQYGLDIFVARSEEGLEWGVDVADVVAIEGGQG